MGKYHTYPSDIRCLLYCLLLVDDYTLDINEQTHKTLFQEMRKRYYTDLPSSDEINLTDNRITEGIIDRKGSFMKIDSAKIRHDVMYAFVTECLVEDSDLEFFLTTASYCVVSEYCRSWNYKRSEGERCLYVPDRPKKMYNHFIDKLQLDIITHCTVSDRGIHDSISKRLNIPEEVLRWDINARKRFVKNSKQESVKMFRARGMIVGCAGAGKTTLLRRLQGREKTDVDKQTETTIGLEVHEDLFVIEDNKLIDFSTRKANSENQYLDNNVVSMTDFAGQVAYYACHQVYLSRRAFYIVVIDMSKNLKEESRMHDTDRHDPTGSLFHSWTYGDYFHFWLQTINTYCNEGIIQGDPKDTTAIKDAMENIHFHPVILIASHKDQLGSTFNTSDTFYSELEACLSKEQTLKRLISPFQYFEVECPPGALTQKQQKSINFVKKCIVETVQKLPQWGEEVPLKWFELEKILNDEKANGEKVLKRSQLKEMVKTVSIDEGDLNDVLRFLHEIGKIIYFSVDKLKDTIIIDVQWFVDAFKYIITDKRHFGRIDNKNPLVNTGKITGQYVEEVWKRSRDNHDVKHFDKNVNGENDKNHDFVWLSYKKHKTDILQYMDKLGLITKIQTKTKYDVGNDEEMYYIPSMNRTDLPDDKKDAIKQKQKSSLMVYFFKSYLPHFFFFRLVVNCLKKWKVCDGDSFFKNAAFYKTKDAGHYFVIAVSKTSIQLQVLRRDGTVKEECVKKIRKAVEDLIKEITETFHRGIIYDMGFSCRDIKITDEDEKFFLKESEIVKEIGNFQEMSCPKHFIGPNDHKIDTNKIRMCLLKREST
ncbi:probable serine/threonine-protein kinase pats1 [Saccostrea echinata]|uniref:probable serine/threonine-protein kinase pats1 n=1 Tax=Saccostrea echinata TaxID=191078 RepID=UPI002A7ECBCE|nr:probable serine/threonine-protein kinase pats1 [Saccostrea echinata]